MKPRVSRLINLCVLFAFVLSGIVIPAPTGPGRGGVESTTLSVSSPLVSAKSKRKHHRNHNHNHQRSKDRKHKGKNSDNNNDDATAAPAPDDWRDFCTGAFTEELPQSKLCTHGPDPAPPGFDVSRAVRAISVEAAEAAPAIICDGDGVSGKRVQVLYVHSSDVPSRYADYLASIRSWAAQADQIFQNSAAETGSIRNIRFVQDTSCTLTVDDVPIPGAAMNGFGPMITQLQSLGYNRTDRMYLIFGDTTSAGICGIGNVMGDDRPDPAVNRNNVGPRYARVDAGCWSGSVAAHELTHNLGGVQLSAPNTSGGFHCIDEYDVMCYSDTPNHPTMRIDCSDRALNSTLLDCGHQDYFNTNPAPDNYLASHWNVANNQFLITGDGTAATTAPWGLHSTDRDLDLADWQRSDVRGQHGQCSVTSQCHRQRSRLSSRVLAVR